jgi:hypothetical protein
MLPLSASPSAVTIVISFIPRSLSLSVAHLPHSIFMQDSLHPKSLFMNTYISVVLLPSFMLNCAICTEQRFEYNGKFQEIYNLFR